MRIGTVLFAAGILAASIGAAGADGGGAPRRIEIAAVPAARIDPSPSPTTVTPVQQQTCGCTAPPNPKQKIKVNSGGRSVCTVTSMACWAP